MVFVETTSNLKIQNIQQSLKTTSHFQLYHCHDFSSTALSSEWVELSCLVASLLKQRELIPRNVVGLAMTLAAVFKALVQRPFRKAVAEQSNATNAWDWLKRSRLKSGGHHSPTHGGSVECPINSEMILTTK